MFRDICRILLAVVLIAAAENAAAVKKCEASPKGKCYRVNSAGEFVSYGEYLRRSKETISASELE